MAAFDQAFDIVVLGTEKGYQNDPRDPGNWTGGAVDQGTLRGTNFGISAASYPTLDIARLLATGAELLLLDEPASGLAAGALDQVMALLRRLQDEGKTLLVVEHNTRVVQQIADHVLFLHQGHLMAEGTPAAIIADPALAEIYFGGAL